MPKGNYKPELESRLKWVKENTQQIKITLQLKYDSDVVDYFADGKNKRNTVLMALRYLMSHEEEVRSWYKGVNK